METRDGFETQPIVVIDDMTTVVAEEPVFCGMSENSLLGAYHQVMQALRERYAVRYKNPAPFDDKAVFTELDSEVVLPHSLLVGKLIKIVHDQEDYTPDEEEQILRIVANFLQKARDEN